MLPLSLRKTVSTLNEAPRAQGAFKPGGNDRYRVVEAAARGALDDLANCFKSVGDFGRTLVSYERQEFTPPHYAISHSKWDAAAFLVNHAPGSWHVNSVLSQGKAGSTAVGSLNRVAQGLVHLLEALAAGDQPINVPSLVAIILASSPERREEVLANPSLLEALFAKIGTHENMIVLASLSIGKPLIPEDFKSTVKAERQIMSLFCLHVEALMCYSNREQWLRAQEILDGQEQIQLSFIHRELAQGNGRVKVCLDGESIATYYLYDGLLFGFSLTEPEGLECRPAGENTKIIQISDVDKAGGLLAYIQNLVRSRGKINIDHLIKLLMSSNMMRRDRRDLLSTESQALIAQLLSMIDDKNGKDFVSRCFKIAGSIVPGAPLVPHKRERSRLYLQLGAHRIAISGSRSGSYFYFSGIAQFTENHPRYRAVLLAREGDLSGLEELFRQNSTLSLCGSQCMDQNGSQQTMLDAAIRGGHWHIVAFLLGQVPEVDWNDLRSVQAKLIDDGEEKRVSEEYLETPIELVNQTPNSLLNLTRALADSEGVISAVALLKIIDQASVERCIELWGYWIKNRERFVGRISTEGLSKLEQTLASKAQVPT
jgi:hypothetical protein